MADSYNFSRKAKLVGLVSGQVTGGPYSSSALTVQNGEVSIVNPTATIDSAGNQIPAGAGTILSVGPNDTFLNASYIKTGVIDANLVRTGQLQTVASWNNKSYGSAEDAVESQQGFTGGYVYCSDWGTTAANTCYVDLAPWAEYLDEDTTGTVSAASYFTAGDYIRVTGANFGAPAEFLTVRVATTEHSAMSGPAPTVDGISTVSGNLILLKNQNDPSQNGVYSISATTASITSVAYTAGYVTYTSTAHGLAAGNLVTITGLAPAALNVSGGEVLAAGLAANTFRIAFATDPGTITDQAGTLYKPWSRAAEFDTGDEVDTDLMIGVTSGTVNGGTGWRLSTPEPITIGTTNLTFVRNDAGLRSIDPDGDNGNVGVIDQDDGPINYATITTVASNRVTYSTTGLGKRDIGVEEGQRVARRQEFIPTISRVFQVADISSELLPPPNPAQIYEVTVTTTATNHFVPGDYVELVNCGPIFSGVWYITNVLDDDANPDTESSSKFTFRHRFGVNASASLNGANLPSLEAPAAIRVRKTYSVSSNGDLTASSLNIRTARAQGDGEPIFKVTNDEVVIRDPLGNVVLSVNADSASLVADEITVGSGDQIVRIGTDEATGFSGVWAGSANPNTATVKINAQDGILQGTGAYFNPNTNRSAIVVAGDSAQGDLAAANSGTLHLGATTATATGTGTFTPRLQLASGVANFRNSEIRVKSIDVYESDSDVSSGTRRATIRGSTVTAGRLVIENTAGSNNADLLVDGTITVNNYGLLSHNGTTFTIDNTSTGNVYIPNNLQVHTFDINRGGATTAGSGIIQIRAVPTTTSAANCRLDTVAGVVGNTGHFSQIKYSTSSRKYKTNIVDADVNVLSAAKRIAPRHFQSLIEGDNGATHLGFIAEEVFDAGLTHGVDLDENGDPAAIDTTALLAGLYCYVKHLEQRIAELEG